VLLAYLCVGLAALCGVPVLVLGWIAGSRCSGEGFRCLGWIVYGMLGAALVAAVAVPIIAWRLRLGPVFGLLAITLVLVPVWLGDGSVNAGTAFLGPGLAAWVSEPRERPQPGVRHWVPRVGAVLVLSIGIPLMGRVI
jgi:hypothetical protein